MSAQTIALASTETLINSMTETLFGTNTDSFELAFGYIITRNGIEFGDLTFSTMARAQSYIDLLTDELNNDDSDFRVRAVLIGADSI